MNFRNLADTRTLIRQAKSHRRAVVIGGGFLGLEAAEGSGPGGAWTLRCCTAAVICSTDS